LSSRPLRTPFILLLAVISSAYQPRSGLGTRPAEASELQAPARPEPLSDAEAGDQAAIEAIARRFNPAMAFPIEDVWPVEVRYAWHDGADLRARVEGRAGRPTREYVAVKSRELSRTDWSGLPHRSAAGDPIRYYVDAPGDDRPVGKSGLTSWRKRWRQIVQPKGAAAPPTASAYAPTQYAHVFWWNRAEGLLAIQYWFYYPFNEWVNRHEADWEHIQIILRAGGPRPPGPAATVPAPTPIDLATTSLTPLAHQFFFHDFWSAPTSMVRLAGSDPREDHPLVYVGGKGNVLGWGGSFSGGSYPLPARFKRAGCRSRLMSPDDDTSTPARFIAASDFKVIVLPEPSRLDARRSPELSWLRLPFYAGQRTMSTNPPGYRALGRDHPPVQPGIRRGWMAPPTDPVWNGAVVEGTARTGSPGWPASWSCVNPGDSRSCFGGGSSLTAQRGHGRPSKVQ
jgi:hypothetical protein